MDIFIESEQGAQRNISSGRLQFPEDYGEDHKDSLWDRDRNHLE